MIAAIPYSVAAAMPDNVPAIIRSWANTASAPPLGDIRPVPVRARDVRARMPGDAPPLTAASALLDRLVADNAISAVSVSHARQAISLLSLWKAPAPTELSDGSDGDFSMLWRKDQLVASLYFSEGEVVGYAYKPGMDGPWTLEADDIGVPALNKFLRILG
jgi:hypothetical protein